MFYISDVVYTMSFVLDTNIYQNTFSETLNNASSTEYMAIATGVCLFHSNFVSACLCHFNDNEASEKTGFLIEGMT